MKVLPLLLILLAIQHQSIGQKIDLYSAKNGTLIWPQSNGLIRVHYDKSYFFCNEKGEIIMDLSGYKFASDFVGEFAEIYTYTGKCGVIDSSGALVIDTLWDEIKVSPSGFFVLGRHNGSFIFEKRGESQARNYPELDWYIANTNKQIIPYKLRNVLLVNNLIQAETIENRLITIDLLSINFSYYHPLMKAIKRVDSYTPKYQILPEKQTIRYVDHSNQALLEMPIMTEDALNFGNGI